FWQWHIMMSHPGGVGLPIIHVFGYEETEAKVSCSYDEGYESYEKYLCRNYCSSDDVLITTTEAHKNRYSISDDTNKQVFTATISNLNQNYAGKYWCGVTKSGILKDHYPAEVKLKWMLLLFPIITIPCYQLVINIVLLWNQTVFIMPAFTEPFSFFFFFYYICQCKISVFLLLI
uniref:Immunoglobulin V-set domain-containing protein n=1 Tax=Anabas testudineus TaxID=64144 RepID=A0A7N6AEJ9_ANATE